MLEAPFKWRVPLVVLGAGKGRRLGPAAGGLPKILLEIGDHARRAQGITLLDLLVRAWKPWVSRLHLVVADGEPVREVLGRLQLPSQVHLQPEPDGTVNALLRLFECLPERFVVVLGDCLLRGRMESAEDPFPGVGVWREADQTSIMANFAVGSSAGWVTEVEEKPGQAGDRLCGMGVYFLDRNFLEAVSDLPPNSRGRRELTDALAHFLAKGGLLRTSFFSGSYVNVNTPTDLERARQLFGNP